MALIDRSAKAPWPISRRALSTHTAGFTDTVGREVVMEHELPHGILKHGVDDLFVIRVPKVTVARTCVSPRVKSELPWVREGVLLRLRWDE